MNYFKTFPDDNGYLYSLDMVRVKLKFSNRSQELSNYIKHLSEYDLSVDVQYFESFSPYKYRHLWTISLPGTDCSFVIGLNQSNDKNGGFCEFNPNKCEKYSKFTEIRNFIWSLAYDVRLIRYDCAIDIPLRRENAKLVRDNGKNYQLWAKMDGITEYLGRRSNNGFVKLYDKTEESDLDYDLTRLELTLDAAQDPLEIFPTVYLYDEQYALLLDNTLSSTQRVLVELLRQCDNVNFYLKKLDKDIRKKITPYIADRVLSPNKNCFTEIKLLALSYCK